MIKDEAASVDEPEAAIFMLYIVCVKKLPPPCPKLVYHFNVYPGKMNLSPTLSHTYAIIGRCQTCKGSNQADQKKRYFYLY